MVNNREFTHELKLLRSQIVSDPAPRWHSHRVPGAGPSRPNGHDIEGGERIRGARVAPRPRRGRWSGKPDGGCVHGRYPEPAGPRTGRRSFADQGRQAARAGAVAPAAVRRRSHERIVDDDGRPDRPRAARRPVPVPIPDPRAQFSNVDARVLAPTEEHVARRAKGGGGPKPWKHLGTG